MVQSDAPDVSTYIEQAPERWQESLRLLRRLCLEELPGFEEGMAYGMPSYRRDGEVEVTFAGQKNYVSLYVMRTEVVRAHAEQLGKLSVGKSCIRFRRLEQIDESVVRSLLAGTREGVGPIC